MKYTIEELVNDKAKCAQYRDELFASTDIHFKHQLAMEAKYKKDIPSPIEGKKWYLSNLDFENEVCILTILSEIENPEKLKAALEREEERITWIKEKGSEDGFNVGFLEGYLWHSKQFIRMYDDINENNTPQERFENKAKEAEKYKLRMADVAKRQAREKILGVKHAEELHDHWVFTTEQLDKIEALIAEGKTVAEAQQKLKEDFKS